MLIFGYADFIIWNYNGLPTIWLFSSQPFSTVHFLKRVGSDKNSGVTTTNDILTIFLKTKNRLWKLIPETAKYVLFFSQQLFACNKPEAIAVYVHYFNGAVFAQVFAELGYIHIHAAAIEVSVAAPDTFERELPGKQVIFIFAKHEQ